MEKSKTRLVNHGAVERRKTCAAANRNRAKKKLPSLPKRFLYERDKILTPTQSRPALYFVEFLSDPNQFCRAH
ncbi:hypothetical protein CEXT_282121 [Caerostris extrusa]|uniref:Uncharacterized protein n=1 Tax=Caerostris extrusa TaxID=172846 RepID=A0AAV4MX23_CAEEX|nr:hypothetical protein CEXT_282121 [Caerostris extrusa]